jgi:hypothetical protein
MMQAATYHDAAPEWLAAGFVPLPIDVAAKKLLVRNAGKFGRPAAGPPEAPSAGGGRWLTAAS